MPSAPTSRPSPRAPRGASVLTAALLLAACATNPATGRRELMLVSEDQEIAMGREYDPQIVASLGLYPDTALQRYVQELGLRMAAQSERPRLPWTFRVLDDPTVNAFAVPGGFIYITRGILAHLGSEAQLAAVLGHEIGHVTARHSASSMSRQQLAQLGLAVGAAVDERVARYADVAGQGLGVLFLKYGRDDENESDALGLRYMRRTGHDIREMPLVFQMLGSLSAGGEAGRVPDWLSTHPAPEDRFTRISTAITRTPQDTVGVVVLRDAYLRRLDDVVFGNDPRNGYFAGDRFLHPAMRFSFTFPAGWQKKNEASAVHGVSAAQDAALQLSLAKEPTAAAAARAFAQQQGLQSTAPTSATTNGLATSSASFAAVSGADTLRGAATFVEHNGSVFQLLGYTAAAKWETHQAALTAALRSFAVVTDRAVLGVQPQRMDIITVDRQGSIAELLVRRPSPLTAEQLAQLNQVRVGEPLARGRVIKWVTGPRPPQ